MKLKATIVPCVAIIASSLLLGGCPKGGSKSKGRVPASSNTGGTYQPQTEPLDSDGSGVERLPNDGLSGSDLGADDGSGGPLADIRFELDSAALSPAAEQLLRAHASWL